MNNISRIKHWIVPIILVTVAFLQIYLANIAELSPWKGGGFGMFATIDSPNNRVFYAEGLDQNRQLIRLDVQHEIPSLIRDELRSMPKKSVLHKYATKLLNKQFVPEDIKRSDTLEELLSKNPNIQIQYSSIKVNNQSFYRVRKVEESIEDNNKIKTLTAIRLQMLRIRFNNYSNSIFSEPITEVKLGQW